MEDRRALRWGVRGRVEQVTALHGRQTQAEFTWGTRGSSRLRLWVVRVCSVYRRNVRSSFDCRYVELLR